MWTVPLLFWRRSSNDLLNRLSHLFSTLEVVDRERERGGLSSRKKVAKGGGGGLAFRARERRLSAPSSPLPPFMGGLGRHSPVEGGRRQVGDPQVKVGGASKQGEEGRRGQVGG